jgi:hypothetical protein
MNRRGERGEKLSRDALSCSTGYRHVADSECFDLSKLWVLCVRNHLGARNFTPRSDTAKRKAVTSHRTPNCPQCIADLSLVRGRIGTPHWCPLTPSPSPRRQAL